jgi:hypothetical protein
MREKRSELSHPLSKIGGFHCRGIGEAQPHLEAAALYCTVRTTVPVDVVDPDVAVTVMV